MTQSLGRHSLPREAGPEAQHELNVTPMLDVLLVLLVIFMAAAVGMHRTMDVTLPEPCAVMCPPGSVEPIVLEVLPGSRFLLNKYEVKANELAARLRAVYRGRPTKVLTVAGKPGVPYERVIDAMDVAKSVGVTVLAIQPKRR